MREKLKKEKEEVCCRCMIVGVLSGSDKFASVSARRRRGKNVKRRSERSGRKRLSRMSVSRSFTLHRPVLTSRFSRRRNA